MHATDPLSQNNLKRSRQKRDAHQPPTKLYPHMQRSSLTYVLSSEMSVDKEALRIPSSHPRRQRDSNVKLGRVGSVNCTDSTQLNSRV